MKTFPVRRFIVKCLLCALNSRWLNQTPCKYAFVGNLDNFSRENLESEDKQQPGITVREILDAADRFMACPINNTGVTVMEGDGTNHEATAMDLHELRVSFSPKEHEQT